MDNNLTIIISNLESKLQITNDQINEVTWKIDAFENSMTAANEVVVKDLLEVISGSKKLAEDISSLQRDVCSLLELKEQRFAEVTLMIENIAQQHDLLRNRILP